MAFFKRVPEIPAMYIPIPGVDIISDWDKALDINPTTLKLIADGEDYQRYAAVIWINTKKDEEKVSDFIKLRAKPGFTDAPLTGRNEAEEKLIEKFGEHAVIAPVNATGIVHVATITKAETEEEELKSGHYVTIGFSFTKEVNGDVDKFEVLNRSTPNRFVFPVHPLALAIYGFEGAWGVPHWHHIERSLSQDIVEKISRAAEKYIGGYTHRKTEFYSGDCYNFKYEEDWKKLWALPKAERKDKIEKKYLRNCYAYLINSQLSEEYIERSEEVLMNGFKFAKEANIKIDLNCDPKILTDEKSSPEDYLLVTAIKRKNWEMTEWLVTSGADPNIIKDKIYLTPLMQLIKMEAPVALVNHFLEHKADINADHCGETALSLAVKQGNVSIVKALLEKKADPNFVRSNGETILYTAVREKNIELVKLLLNAGANPSQQCGNGQLPINLVASGPIFSLLKEREQVNASIQLGRSR